MKNDNKGRPKSDGRSKRPTGDLILQEAERLILENGPSNLRLQDIADPLGISVPAIYKHYDGREAVIGSIAAKHTFAFSHQFQDDETRDPLVVLQDNVARYIHYFLDHPVYVLVMQYISSNPKGWTAIRRELNVTSPDDYMTGPLRHLYDNVCSILERGRQLGLFNDIEPLNFYRYMHGSFIFRASWPTRHTLLAGKESHEAKELIQDMQDLATLLVQNNRD